MGRDPRELCHQDQGQSCGLRLHEEGAQAPRIASDDRRRRAEILWRSDENLGNGEKQEIGRHANNRVENSHLPFRRLERAMQWFRRMKTLQKFASVHANVANHFSAERHLADRQTDKLRRAAALAEWQMLAA